MKTIFIYKNNTPDSEETARKIGALLTKKGCIIQEKCTDETQLVISVGGDGTFLQAAKASGFKDVPFLGINTGHLGFFQEFSADELELAAETCVSENFELQSYRTIRTLVECGPADAGEAACKSADEASEAACQSADETDETARQSADVQPAASRIFELDPAINDVLIRQNGSSLIHLKLSIGESFIENFSGDGILIASSAGSTAYNYSLGGSIVDPRLRLLQITPMAPVSNVAFRSFTSSLLLPGSEKIVITPDGDKDALIIVDGKERLFSDIRRITAELSPDEIRIVRLPSYSFWDKVREKFL